jgi:DMSO/TMAO reductase YedYZ molybdopterin-dependent catalytic subunit
MKGSTMGKSKTYKSPPRLVGLAIFLLALFGSQISPAENSGTTTAGISIASSNRQYAQTDRSAEDGMDEVERATRNLHTTGRPQEVDIKTWRLEIKGDGVGRPKKFTYKELQTMEMVKKEVTLVCPGFFTDIAVWEGVPLTTLLESASVGEDYEKVVVHGLDGYTGHLKKEEIDEHLVFLALKVNDVTIPKAHGYPLRLVGEDITGGKWVKWIHSIEVK